MKDCISGNDQPDAEIVFNNGILSIISCAFSRDISVRDEFELEVLCIHPGYSESLSLKDIAERYPNVKEVIYESWKEGDIYRYGNHKKGEWEKVGTTIGFV